MRLEVSLIRSQALLVFLSILFMTCTRNTEEIYLIPPPTNPLSRNYIGFGVVNISFLHVVSEPRLNSESLGFLRRGALVRVIERRVLLNRGIAETWVMVEIEYPGALGGRIQGWLMEDTINVFNNESQAITASEAISP